VIRESFPPQISANVRGTLPDSCTEIAEITQSRDGNAIAVTIPTVRDPEALCAQALVPVEVSVIEPTGSETQVLGHLGKQTVVGVFRERIDAKPGSTIRITPDINSMHLFEPSGARMN